MNLGLTDELKTAFPKITSVQKPLVQNLPLPDPHWLSGFTSAEGCFMVKVINSSRNRLAFQVQLEFTLYQHSRDEQLMRNLVEYLGCGNVYRYKEAVVFKITKINCASYLNEKVIPLL